MVSFVGYAQEGKYQVTDKDYDNREVEMADTMRESGKIYVVVGVILIVFAGIIFYLVRTERQVAKLEEEFASFKSENGQN